MLEGSGAAGERDDTLESHCSFCAVSASATTSAANGGAERASAIPVLHECTTTNFVPAAALNAALTATARLSKQSSGAGRGTSTPCASAAIVTSDTEGVLRVFVRRSVLPT